MRRGGQPGCPGEVSCGPAEEPRIVPEAAQPLPAGGPGGAGELSPGKACPWAKKLRLPEGESWEALLCELGHTPGGGEGALS